RKESADCVLARGTLAGRVICSNRQGEAHRNAQVLGVFGVASLFASAHRVYRRVFSAPIGGLLIVPAGESTADPAPDVVVVGAAARDIAPDDPRGWRLGGGVSYSALTTARLGLRTAALVGVDRTAV